METTNFPTFPTYVTVGIFAATLPLTVVASRRFEDLPTRFLLGAIWLRLLLSALHQYTYGPAVAGQSLNALASALVIGLGAIALNPRLFLLRKLGPIYLMMVCTALSAVVNGKPSGAVTTLLKWSYLAIFAAAFYQSLSRHGAADVCRAVLSLFLAPLTLQLLSVLMDVGKGSDESGGISYIGGYYHEAAFSVLLLIFLTSACIAARKRFILGIVCIVIAIVGLLLANYRTSLLAALPLFTVAIFLHTLKRIVPAGRPFLAILLICAIIGSLVPAVVLLQERFQDVAVVLARGGELIKPPQYFTDAEQDLFSARVVIWSRYIDGYLRGSLLNNLFGFGPDSWIGVFDTYAHNSFVSALYELGLVGCASLLFLFLSNVLASATARSHEKLLALAAHIGFLVLAQATMPLWLIEGNVLFALILSYTWTLDRGHRVPRAMWRSPLNETSRSSRIKPPVRGHERGECASALVLRGAYQPAAPLKAPARERTGICAARSAGTASNTAGQVRGTGP